MYEITVTLKPELKQEGKYTFSFDGVKTNINCSRIEYISKSVKEAIESLNLEEIEAISIKPNHK